MREKTYKVKAQHSIFPDTGTIMKDVIKLSMEPAKFKRTVKHFLGICQAKGCHHKGIKAEISGTSKVTGKYVKIGTIRLCDEHVCVLTASLYSAEDIKEMIVEW